MICWGIGLSVRGGASRARTSPSGKTIRKTNSASDGVFFLSVTLAGLKPGASWWQRPKGRMVLDEIEIGRRHHELEVDLLRIPDRDGEFHGRRSLKRPAPIGRRRRALMPQAAVGLAPCVAEPGLGPRLNAPRKLHKIPDPSPGTDPHY